MKALAELKGESKTQDYRQPKRRRVAKACEYCRKKKIRCDGQNPCANCSHNSASCYYVIAEKKRTPKKQSTNAKALREMDSKLNRLEDLVVRLVDRIDSERSSPNGSSISEHDGERKKGKLNKSSNSILTTTSDSWDKQDTAPGRELNGPDNNADTNDDDSENESSSSLGDSSSEEEDEGSEDDGTHDLELTPSADLFSVAYNQKVTEAGKYHPNLDRSNPLNGDRLIPTGSTAHDSHGDAPETCRADYINDHVFCSVFSPAGFKWVRDKMGPSGPRGALCLPAALTEGHAVFHRNFEQLVAPKGSSTLSPLPDDGLLRYLHSLFHQLEFLEFLAPQDVTTPVVENYIQARHSGNLNSISSSDNLLLSAITLTSFLFLGNFILDTLDIFVKFGLTREDFGELEKKYLNNCLFYYYSLSLIGESVITVRGMILLAFYLERSFSTKNYMVVATLIRLGQALGLHRVDSYKGLSSKESLQRRILWVVCYILDKENSITTGQPPVILDEECTAMIPSDFKSQMIKHYPQYFNASTININSSKSKDEKHFMNQLNAFALAESVGFNYMILYIKLRLAQKCSKCYRKLISASSQVSKASFSSPEKIIKVLQKTVKLGDELRAWKASLPNVFNCSTREEFDEHSLRYPILCEDHQKARLIFRISLYSFYYYDIMIINRVTYTITRKAQDTLKQMNRFNDPELTTLKARLQQEQDAASDRCVDTAMALLKLSGEFSDVFRLMCNSFALFVLSAFFTVFTNAIAVADRDPSLQNICQMILCEEMYFSNFGHYNYLYAPVRFIVCEAILISVYIYERHYGNSYSNNPEALAKIERFKATNQNFCEDFTELMIGKMKKFASKKLSRPRKSDHEAIQTWNKLRVNVFDDNFKGSGSPRDLSRGFSKAVSKNSSNNLRPPNSINPLPSVTNVHSLLNGTEENNGFVNSNQRALNRNLSCNSFNGLSYAGAAAQNSFGASLASLTSSGNMPSPGIPLAVESNIRNSNGSIPSAVVSSNRNGNHNNFGVANINVQEMMQQDSSSNSNNTNNNSNDNNNDGFYKNNNNSNTNTDIFDLYYIDPFEGPSDSSSLLNQAIFSFPNLVFEDFGADNFGNFFSYPANRLDFNNLENTAITNSNNSTNSADGNTSNNANGNISISSNFGNNATGL